LLLGGVVLLLINIIYGLICTWRGNLKAGWFTVALGLVACVLVAVGSTQSAFAIATAPTGGAARGGFGAGRPTATAVQDDPALDSTTATPVQATDTASNDSQQAMTTPSAPADVQVSSSNSADASGGTPTASSAGSTQAPGTPGRRARGTPGGTPSQGNGGAVVGGGQPSGGASGQGNGQGTRGQGQGNGGTGGGGQPSGGTSGQGSGGTRGQANGGAAGGTAPTTAQLDQSGLQLAGLGGGLCILLALALYFIERGRSGFQASSSRGLLNAGAGLFVVVAVAVIPILPGELGGSTQAAAAGPRTVNVARRASATPSSTPTATDTATPMPSLTPMQTDTPLPMPTKIQYSSTYTADLQKSVCTATANALVNLRGDASAQQPAIGRVFAGSLLNVTGSSADKKWWQVINNDNDISVEGWVSADYVSLNSTCTNQTIPVVAGKASSTATATPSPTPSTARSSTATGSDTTSGSAKASAATNAVTAAPCTLLTTSSVNVRPDPSLARPPVGGIPDRTALTAIDRSTDGQWWHVVYGSVDGWINGGTVIASSSCTVAPAATATSVS